MSTDSHSDKRPTMNAQIDSQEYKLAPIESTSDMDIAATEVADITRTDAEAIWHVMLNAAPAAPQPMNADSQKPVAWALQFPEDRRRGTVNYMTTYGTREAAEDYMRLCQIGKYGCAEGDVVVVPLYMAAPQSQWIPSAQSTGCPPE